VKKSQADLTEMLERSGGGRDVPVILYRGKVEIGWEGGS
jgi:glutaredoxin